MRKTTHRGKILQIMQEDVVLPHGGKMKVELVNHSGAAAMIPFLTKDKVVLIKQYRPVMEEYILEIPAGTIDKGETPLQCAKREIIEEVGYAAKKWTKLGKIYPVPGYSTEIIWIYKAENLTEKPTNYDADEVIEPVIFSKKEIQALFKKGKIVDSKTITALAYCGWL